VRKGNGKRKGPGRTNRVPKPRPSSDIDPSNPSPERNAPTRRGRHAADDPRSRGPAGIASRPIRGEPTAIHSPLMPMSVRSISVRRTGQLRVRVNTTASNEGSGLMSLQWYRWPPVTTSLIMPLV
jgi:hypothetical protein